MYAGNSLGQIPPYVDAGPDIYITPEETSAQITEATATAPQSYIEGYLWERITGTSPNITYSSNSALNPLISGITSDEEEFRLTVTNNLGNSASHTMRVLRRGEYQILYTLFDSDSVTSQNGQIRKETYKLYLSPNIPADVTVNLDYKLLFETYLISSQDKGYGVFKITKNGYGLHSYAFNGDPDGQLIKEELNVMSFNSVDNIELYFEAGVEISSPESAAQSLVKLEWENATFVNGIGTVTNLPAVKEISADI